MRTAALSHSTEQPTRAGFTLVEVALAIGVVAFAMITVIALLPVGMNSMKHAREQAAAAACISQISEALMTASTTTGTASGVWGTALPPLTGVAEWTGSSSPSGNPDIPISLGGVPTSASANDARLIAHVAIQYPAASSATPLSTGTAEIYVAWPPTASWSGNSNGSSGSWSNAEGSMSSLVVLLPPNH